MMFPFVSGFGQVARTARSLSARLACGPSLEHEQRCDSQHGDKRQDCVDPLSVAPFCERHAYKLDRPAHQTEPQQSTDERAVDFSRGANAHALCNALVQVNLHCVSFRQWIMGKSPGQRGRCPHDSHAVLQDQKRGSTRSNDAGAFASGDCVTIRNTANPIQEKHTTTSNHPNFAPPRQRLEKITYSGGDKYKKATTRNNSVKAASMAIPFPVACTATPSPCPPCAASPRSLRRCRFPAKRPCTRGRPCPNGSGA